MQPTAVLWLVVNIILLFLSMDGRQTYKNKQIRGITYRDGGRRNSYQSMPLYFELDGHADGRKLENVILLQVRCYRFLQVR